MTLPGGHQAKGSRVLTMHCSLTSSLTEGTCTSAFFMIVKNWEQLEYPTKGFVM